MLLLCLRAAGELPLFGVVCSAVGIVLVVVGCGWYLPWYPVLDWTGYHINACGAPLGGLFASQCFPRDAHACLHGPMKTRGGVKLKKKKKTVTGRV
jgi:hypothetical protein